MAPLGVQFWASSGGRFSGGGGGPPRAGVRARGPEEGGPRRGGSEMKIDATSETIVVEQVAFYISITFILLLLY